MVKPLSELTFFCNSESGYFAEYQRFTRCAMCVQLELGIAPWLQLDFVDIRHSGERSL